MAELKPLGRAVAQPSAPDLSAAGQVYGNLGKVVKGVSGAIGNYVEAQNTLDSSFVQSEYANSLNNMLVDSLQPANLFVKENGAPFDRYYQSGAELIEKAVAQTPKSFQSEVRQNLEGVLNNNTLKVKQAFQSDLQNRNRSAIEVMLNESFSGMSNAIREGDNVGFIENRNQAKVLIDSSVAANVMSPAEAANAHLKLEESEIQAKYFRLGNQAAKESAGSLSRVMEIFSNEAEDLTPSQFDAALKWFEAGAAQTGKIIGPAREKEKDLLLAQIDEKKAQLDWARSMGQAEDIVRYTDQYQKLLNDLEDLNHISKRESAQAIRENTAANLAELRNRRIEDIEEQISKKKLQFQQYMQGGLPERAGDVKTDITALNKELLSLRAITKKQAFDENLGLLEVGIKSQYFQRGINDANAEPGTVEQQLNEFATVFRDELTEQDKILAIQSYISGAQFANTLKQESRAISYADISNKIASGEISTPAQILDYDLSALQQKQAEGQLIKKAAKTSAATQKTNEAIKFIQQGGGSQDLLTPEQKTAAYSEMAKTLLEARRNETDNPNYELTQDDNVLILKQMNTPVPWVTSRINYALTKSDPKTEGDLIADALSLGRQLSAEAPNVLKAISAEARSIMTMANSNLLSTNNADIGNVITQARAAANPDDPTKEAYAKRWRGIGEKDLQKYYKSIFSDNPKQNPDTYGQFLNNLQLYNNSSDKIEDAVESVAQVMRPAYGKDPFFEKGKEGYLPSSKAIPYAELGNWYENQIFLSLYALTQRQEKDLSIDEHDKLRWVYGDMPEKISEKTLMNNNLRTKYHKEQGHIFPNKPLLAKYRGKEVEIYYQADPVSRISEDGKPTYMFYFKDEKGQKNFIIDPKSQTGSGYWTERPKNLEQFLGSVYREMNEDKMSKIAEGVYIAKQKEEKGGLALMRKYRQAGPKEVEELIQEKRNAVEMIKNQIRASQESVVPEIKRLSKIDLPATILGEDNG